MSESCQACGGIVIHDDHQPFLHGERDDGRYEHGAPRWDDVEDEDREVLTLALRNLWDEVDRRGA